MLYTVDGEGAHAERFIADDSRIRRAGRTSADGGTASDFVMAEVIKIGGITGWLRAAALTQADSVPMSNHLWPEISARLLCCTPAHWLEYADWWNPILKEPLHVEQGMAIVDVALGSGVDWNQDAVRRFAA